MWSPAVWSLAVQVRHRRPPCSRARPPLRHADTRPPTANSGVGTGTRPVLFTPTARRGPKLNETGLRSVQRLSARRPTQGGTTPAMSHEPGNTLSPHASRGGRTGVAHVRRAVVAVVGVAAVLIVASASSTAFAAGTTVDVAASTNFGTVLVDTQGFALYTSRKITTGSAPARDSASRCGRPSPFPLARHRRGRGRARHRGGHAAEQRQVSGDVQRRAALHLRGRRPAARSRVRTSAGSAVVQVSGSQTPPTTAAPTPTTGSTSPPTASPTTTPAASTTPTTRPAAASVGVP